MLEILLALASQTGTVGVSAAVDSAEIYYAMRDHAAVVRLLAPVETPRLRQRVLLGWSWYRLGRFAEARVTFEAGLEATPDNLDLLNGYGFACYRLGDAPAAEKAFRAVLERNPERLESQRGLAFVLFTSKRFAECLPMFDALLQARPPAADIEHHLMKSVDGAVQAWRAAGRTHAEIVQEAWRLATAGHRRAAVEIFRAVVRADPFHPGARLGVGKLGGEFGYAEEALAALQGLLRENPDDVEARVALARHLLREGQMEEAIAQMQWLEREAPADPRVTALRAVIEAAPRKGEP